MKRNSILFLVCFICMLMVIPAVVSGAPPTLVANNIGKISGLNLTLATPTMKILKPQTITVISDCQKCNNNCDLNAVNYSAYAGCKEYCEFVYGTCQSLPITPENCIQCNNQCNAHSMVDNDRFAFAQCREKCSATFGSECGTNKYWTPLTCPDCQNNCIGLTGNDETTCLQDCANKFGDASCNINYLNYTIATVTSKYTGKTIKTIPQITKKQYPTTLPTTIRFKPQTLSLPVDCQDCYIKCDRDLLPNQLYRTCRQYCLALHGTCLNPPVTPLNCLQCQDQCSMNLSVKNDRNAFVQCREKCSASYGSECETNTYYSPVSCPDCQNMCTGLTGNDKTVCLQNCVNKFGEASCNIYTIGYTFVAATPEYPDKTIQIIPQITSQQYPTLNLPVDRIIGDNTGGRTVQNQPASTPVLPTINRGIFIGGGDQLKPQTQIVSNSNFGTIGRVFMSNVSTGNVTRNATSVVVNTTMTKK